MRRSEDKKKPKISEEKRTNFFFKSTGLIKLCYLDFSYCILIWKNTKEIFDWFIKDHYKLKQCFQRTFDCISS
jgi:hypothetical protein